MPEKRPSSPDSEDPGSRPSDHPAAEPETSSEDRSASELPAEDRSASEPSADERSGERSGGAGSTRLFEEDLDVYPLRDPSEDPLWSVRVARTWWWIALGSLAFILALTVLGFFYE